MIMQWGQRYSPISARSYLIVFSSFDLISIAIQGTGGGIAASAGSSVPPKSTNTGSHIMLAGIAIQLVSMGVFCGLWLYFLYAARSTKYSRILAATVTFSAACIVVRNTYRCIELAQGFDGYLAYHEVFFAVLDAFFMALAPAVFNIWWPSNYVCGVAEYEDVKMNDVAGRDQMPLM